jgi:hypothetical protein
MAAIFFLGSVYVVCVGAFVATLLIEDYVDAVWCPDLVPPIPQACLSLRWLYLMLPVGLTIAGAVVFAFVKRDSRKMYLEVLQGATVFVCSTIIVWMALAATILFSAPVTLGRPSDQHPGGDRGDRGDRGTLPDFDAPPSSDND